MTSDKILFLGPEESPLVEWLRQSGEEVVTTSAEITAGDARAGRFTWLVSYGYRHILGQEILDLFPDRAINLHISYLPWNRGADPNLWSFVENTPKGVTIHHLDRGVDTGDIIVQEEVALGGAGETLASSYAKLQAALQELFKRSWAGIKRGTCGRVPQSGAGSYHKVKDRQALAHLLSRGWDTPVAELARGPAPGPDTD